MELYAEPPDGLLVDGIVGCELQRLLPGLERLRVAVLGPQRDPVIEKRDGALFRVVVAGPDHVLQKRSESPVGVRVIRFGSQNRRPVVRGVLVQPKLFVG